MASAPSQNPRYEAHENPPVLVSLGLGAQFSLIACTTLLVTPVVVAKASDGSYLQWMVFASLLVCGLSTLIQVRRLGPVGAGALLPMFTAAVSIPFCITAMVDGGPATLTALVVVSAALQLVISRWLSILRRIVTPMVVGTILAILSITLASVVPRLMNDVSPAEPVGGPLTALITLGVICALILRRSPVLRLWAPVAGLIVGCAAAAGFGFYDPSAVIDAAWIGVPTEYPGLGFEFGIPFWTLLPAFLFLGIIIAIQSNGEAITQQQVAWREERAVDFRQVQGAVSGTGVTNALAGIAGTVPNMINPGAVAYSRTTGVASKKVGYWIGGIFILVAFLPKVYGLLGTIPGPVMAGYLIILSGTLFVDGARTVLQNEPNPQRVLVAGICFWTGAAFQFGLFSLSGIGPVWAAFLKSAISTGGLALIGVIMYLELTNPRRMRFRSRLHIDALPELNEFMSKFAASRGWDDAMKERLSAVAEETLLTLAPLDLEGLLLEEEETEERKDERTLVVLATGDGNSADLEFIGGGGEGNIEDQVRQLQQHVGDSPPENEISLRLLRNYSSSVKHQQYNNTDIITIRVDSPGAE